MLLAAGLGACGRPRNEHLLCRHTQEDPGGTKDFHVRIRGSEAQVTFHDGTQQQADLRDQEVSWQEYEGKAGNPGDNDEDDIGAQGAPILSQSTRDSPVFGLRMHFDKRHDRPHHSSLNLRSLTFTEREISPNGGDGTLITSGRCRRLRTP